jgi:hypothetical protein
MTKNNFEKAREVRQRFEAELLNMENVVGVGIGLRKIDDNYTDEVAIVVMVKKKMTMDEVSPEDLIPAELDGVTVDVQEVGELHASG